MPDAEPHRLSAASLARLIEAGELTAEAVVRSCLDRIRERDPVVRAWAWLDPEQALDAARACDRGGRAAASLQGRAVRHQGHFRHRRHAGRLRLADLYRMPAELPGERRVLAAGRRGDPDRKNRDDRIRQPASRSDLASAKPDCTRRADRRAARRLRSPISWCRWRSGRRPAAR